MDIKVSKSILGKIYKIQKNVEQNIKHAEEINNWIKRYFEMEFSSDEIQNSKIVTGVMIHVGGKEYLDVEGYGLAGAFWSGTYSYQANQRGELYFRIDETTFLQLHFSGHIKSNCIFKDLYYV